MGLAAPAWTYDVIIASSIGVALGLGPAAWFALRGVGADPRQRTRAAAAGSALGAGWLGLDLILAAHHAFRAGPTQFPWIVVAVLGPIAAGGLLFSASGAARRAVSAIPTPWLLGVQAARVEGGVFLALLAIHRLPGQFAWPAGVGDVAVGVAAPFVALAYLRDVRGSRPLATAFSIAGILDLVIAVGSGVLSAPGPQQVFTAAPTTALMALIPMVLIPVFLVPLAVLDHWATLRALLAERRALRATAPRSAPARPARPLAGRLAR